MTAKKFVLSFVAVGVLLPVAWFAFYWALGKNPDVSRWMMRTAGAENAVLMFWPSSILMLGDPEDKSLMLPVLSVALNAMLYAILGWLFWFGLKRSRIVLVATVVLILAGWYGVLSL